MKHSNAKFWKFTAVNMIILLAGLSFYWLLWDWILANADLAPLQAGVAYIVYAIQAGLGWPVGMAGPTTLQYSMPEPGFPVEIVALCIGLGEMLFFAFLVLLFRGAGWKAKGYGLAIFLPLIFMINILRLVLIYPLALGFGVQAMWDIHWHIWKWGMFAVLMALFTIWYMFWTRKDLEKVMKK